MDIIKQRIDINSLIDWNGLQDFLDDIDTFILKRLYFPHPDALSFDILFRDLNKNRNRQLLSKSTLRRKIERLNKENLLILIKTKPLLINSDLSISEVNLKRLVNILCYKHGMEKII